MTSISGFSKILYFFLTFYDVFFIATINFNQQKDVTNFEYAYIDYILLFTFVEI